ncbi:MAG: hypothetical protein R2765_03970 [Ferruginibacter sp.]
MKIIFSLLFFSFSYYLNAQKLNPAYDSALAKKYGADDYGMKMYVLVILKTGTNTTTNKVLTDSLFAGHMSNIAHMVKINKLVVAGPFSKNEKAYRGIFILNVKDLLKQKNYLIKTRPLKKNYWQLKCITGMAQRLCRHT